MFGNCVWLQLNSTHNMNKIIFNFSELFMTHKFIGHFTLDYNIEKQHFNKKNYIINNLVKDGELYETENNGFFAVQQDYITDQYPFKKYHLSLAYKLDKPFNLKERDFIYSIKLDDEIKKEDVQIRLWNCNSKNPKNWKFIK